MAAGHLDNTCGQRGRPIQFVGSDNGGRSRCHGLFDQAVDKVSTVAVEACVRLVEQPQQRAATDQHRHRSASSLASGQTRHWYVPQSAPHTEPIHHGIDLGNSPIAAVRSIGCRPETNVLFDREIVVQRRAVAEEANAASNRPSATRGGEVGAEHPRPAVVQGGQTGTKPEQRRLACSVWPLEENDLARLDLEICAGQRRKPTNQAHGLFEVNHSVGHSQPRYAHVVDETLAGDWVVPMCGEGHLPSRPTPMQKRTASIIGGIGRALIGLGLIVITFAVFQLYGTGILEAQSQEALTTEFDDRLAQLEEAGLVETADDTADAQEVPLARPTDSDALNAAIATAFAPELGEREGPDFTVSVLDPDALSDIEVALLTPQSGQALGSIEIPDIGLKRNIVEGIGRSDLRQGPGHYPGSPLPGQPGNVAIAGHRTTYGEPFRNLHLLEPGDLIKVTTFQGESFYQVMAHTTVEGEEVGYFIVEPSQTEVLDDFGDNRLTLTACHPIASARQRIIVTAQLVSAPQEVIRSLTDERLAELAGEELESGSIEEFAIEEDAAVGVEENALEESLGWNWEERTSTIAWALAALAVVVVALMAARRWRKWLVYLGAAPVFFIALFFCFIHLDRMLPAL